jgi:hypothetical protein
MYFWVDDRKDSTIFYLIMITIIILNESKLNSKVNVRIKYFYEDFFF